MKASKHGNLDVVKYLVENGADVNIKNNSKKTALAIARSNEQMDTVYYLKLK